MYLIITDNGPPFELETHTPTYERLVEDLDDLPAHIPLPDTRELRDGRIVAWVGDDFVARETRGEVTRNITATVLMWALGAPRQPYAGNIAFSGVRESIIEGRQPTNITSEGLILIQTLVFDIDRVLAGDPNPDTPDNLRTQFQADAVTAAEMEYEQLSLWTTD